VDRVFFEGVPMRERALHTGWRRILVATDFSRPSRLALVSAERLARGRETEIVLVNVIDMPTMSGTGREDVYGLDEACEQWIEESRVALRAWALQGRTRGARIAEVEVRIGSAWVEILEAAKSHEADLVILGNSGRGRFHRLLLGSTAEKVVRNSPVPVLVTRGRALRALRRVLVPVSADEGSLTALRFALERLPGGVEIEAFHAVPTITAVEPWMPVPPPRTDEAASELREFLEAAGVGRVGAGVALGNDTGAAILERARAWKADLILLSTHGRTGLAHMFLGSVAEKVARYTDRPVLILPPPGRSRVKAPERWDEALAPAEFASAWG
jgi:nucleotide-binding universal stress UspA family protein